MSSPFSPRKSLWLALALMLALACAPATGVLTPLLVRATPLPTSTTPASNSTPATPAPTAVSMATGAPAASPTVPATTAASPTATPALDEQVLGQMRHIEQTVEEIRGLRPEHPVERAIISREEMARRVEEDFLEDYSPEEAQQDAVELWLFGLADRDINLYDIHKAMFSEGIAGYYDDETKTMYVVADDGFPPHARMTYAHEYTHALQDQTWDLRDGLGFKDEVCEQDSEYCAGVQALIEGDATLTEFLWFWEAATERERQAIRAYYDQLDMPGWDASPEFLQDDILFPYVQGQDFVAALFRQGGWDAVNAAYENPPVSTEQILHPERYPDDRPVAVDLPDLPALLGPDWEAVVEHNALGEFWLYLVLAKSDTQGWRLDEKVAQRAAEGWGGDAYAVYHNPATDAGVLLHILRWDTPEDAAEFTNAFLRYAERRFGPPRQDAERWLWEGTPWGTVIFATDGPQGHIWIIAPDTDLAQRLYQAAR